MSTRKSVLMRSNFNPRTHMGCDMDDIMGIDEAIDFNPRTHMGCDNIKQR